LAIAFAHCNQGLRDFLPPTEPERARKLHASFDLMATMIITILCRVGAAMIAVLAFFFALGTQAVAENSAIASLRAAERKSFTDQQIMTGFFKVTFGAEFHVAGRVDRIRKYDGPVRVYIENRAKPDRSTQVAAVIADIARHIQHLDIAITDSHEEANTLVTLVTLVRNRDLARTIRALYGRAQAQKIQHSLDPQCLSGFRKDDSFRIVRSDVILAADAGEFIFYDCAYEELLQALGPINDDSSVPWTMFNDNVQKGFFDIYDQYLLNILYDRRIRPGMTRAEVRAVMPEVLISVRAWVAKINNLSK
jgi:hypothetical protein